MRYRLDLQLMTIADFRLIGLRPWMQHQ